MLWKCHVDDENNYGKTSRIGWIDGTMHSFYYVVAWSTEPTGVFFMIWQWRTGIMELKENWYSGIIMMESIIYLLGLIVLPFWPDTPMIWLSQEKTFHCDDYIGVARLQYLLLSNFVKQVLNPPAAEQWVCWNPRTSEKHFSPETETEISSERDFVEYDG